MVTATFFTPFSGLSIWYGTVTIATPTHVRVATATREQNFYGTDFAVDQFGNITAGTLTSTNYLIGGVLQYEATGLNHSIVTLFSYLLANNPEGAASFLLDGNDTLTGSNGEDRLRGYGGDDFLSGNSGQDTLGGGNGNDSLDGGAGDDSMAGGSGNDVYYRDSFFDVITELPNEGIDTIVTSVTFTAAIGRLPDNVENATLTSPVGTLLGNDLDNVLIASVHGDTPYAFPHSLSGYGGDDTLVASPDRDSLAGGAGDDLLNGGGESDTLDGGEGVDTAVFSGNRSSYTIGNAATSASGPDGSDTLTSIERLQFSDKKLAFDLGSGEAAGNTVRIIGAAFDAPAIQQHPDWVGIGLDLFDGGMSMQAVSDLVVQVMGLSNTDFVTTVYTNVVGTAPSSQDRDYFVGLLQGSGGNMTQAQLLEIAANADINAQNIDLVGLQQSGVEFV